MFLFEMIYVNAPITKIKLNTFNIYRCRKLNNVKNDNNTTENDTRDTLTTRYY